MTTIFLIFAGANTSWQSEAQNAYSGTENQSSSALLKLETKTEREPLGVVEGDRWQMGHSLSGNPSTTALPPPPRKVAKQNHTPLLKKKPQKPNKMKNKNHKIKTNSTQRPQGQRRVLSWQRTRLASTTWVCAHAEQPGMRHACGAQHRGRHRWVSQSRLVARVPGRWKMCLLQKTWWTAPFPMTTV